MMGMHGYGGWEAIALVKEEPDARAKENARCAELLKKCPMRTVCLSCLHAIGRDERHSLARIRAYDANPSSPELVFSHHREALTKTKCPRCAIERETARFVFIRKEA